MVKVVLDSGRFDHTMELMAYIIPLFLMDPTAVGHGDLTYILSHLVSADQTYISLAKTMITGNFPGPVTKEMGNMLHSIIAHFDNLSSFSRKDILLLLTKLLIDIPKWSSNTSILYLLDIVCSYAFDHKVCYWALSDFYEEMHTENNKKVPASSFFSIFSGLSGAGHTLTLASGHAKFSWLSYFVLQAEDNYMQKSGLWRCLVDELADAHKPLEEALAEAGRKAEVPVPTSGQLVIYRWAQQGMDTPPDHPMAFVFWQRFVTLFLSRPAELNNGQEVPGVGMKFFEGMINSMYFNKIKASLKTGIDCLENAMKDSEDKSNFLLEDLSKLYRTLYIWLDDSKVLDASLYTPALTPIYDPHRLVKVLSKDTEIWVEFYNGTSVAAQNTAAVREWKSLHFREGSVKKKSSATALVEENPTKRIIRRLRSYDARLPPPPLRRLAKPIPIFPSFSSTDSLTQFLMGPLASLNDFSDHHCNNISGYGSLNCSYLEMIVNLWTDEEISVYCSVACPGSKVGKETVACSGPALINLSYFEAKRQEGVSVKIDTNRKQKTEIEERLLAPVLSKYVISAAILNSIIQKILLSFEKDLGKGVSSIHLPMASHLFCYLAKSTTENWLSVPPLRHFISECLENLAAVVVSQGECQAEIILEILKDSPHLSSVLTSYFFPSNDELLNIYKKIGELPLGDGSLSFVLLSKLDIPEWLKAGPSDKELSGLTEVIFRNLEITGVSPDPARLMIHGLHRRHLSHLLSHQFPRHFLHILQGALALSSCNQIDPDIFYDILATTVGNKQLTAQLEAEQVAQIIADYAASGEYDYFTILAVISEVSSHFEKDKLKFGLYGLYPKYRSYLRPLAHLFSLLSLQMIHSEVQKNQGLLNSEVTEFLWRNVKLLYDPWLSPVSPAAKASTANWIQQLSDEGASLMPWIPGDSSLAKLILDSMTDSLKVIIEHEDQSLTLSNLLNIYTTYYAATGIKDHIFGVVHPALSSLDWSNFSPSLTDIEAMMKIISMFLPQCHAFLGTIFVQIDWKTLITIALQSPELGKRVVPAVFCLMIKLSSEPSVRQGGRLLGIVTQSESWSAWHLIEYPHYEALAQWYVMSVDCRTIVKHKERNPLDAAIIRLFLAAAEFSKSGNEEQAIRHQSDHTGKKQIMWVKCCAKLLSSVCSKQKNFLSINQPALHTTLRKLLDDMDRVATPTRDGHLKIVVIVKSSVK